MSRIQVRYDWSSPQRRKPCQEISINVQSPIVRVVSPDSMVSGERRGQRKESHLAWNWGAATTPTPASLSQELHILLLHFVLPTMLQVVGGY